MTRGDRALKSLFTNIKGFCCSLGCFSDSKGFLCYFVLFLVLGVLVCIGNPYSMSRKDLEAAVRSFVLGNSNSVKILFLKRVMSK